MQDMRRAVAAALTRLTVRGVADEFVVTRCRPHYSGLRWLPSSCWCSLLRGLKAGHMPNTNLWMNAWKASVRCLKNTWSEWTPSANPSRTASVSCLSLSTVWWTSAASCSEKIPRLTSRTAESGSKRESTCSLLSRHTQLGHSDLEASGARAGLDDRCVWFGGDHFEPYPIFSSFCYVMDEIWASFYSENFIPLFTDFNL